VRDPVRIALVVLALFAAQLAHATSIRVEITGLDEALEANARAHLSLVSYASVPDLNETNIRAMHARAPLELRAALEPFGYYEPEIHSNLTLREGTWIAQYDVKPGEPVLVTKVDFRISGPGESERRLRAVLDASTVEEGTVLRHDEYERTRDTLLAKSLELGYRDAQLTEKRIEVDPARRSAQVTLHLETGPRYRFGEITFEQDALRPDVLQRYVHFEPGDPYDAKKLLDLQYGLYDSEYYSAVEIAPGEPVGDAVPITVRAQPRGRHSYRVGLGYGTDTRARLSLGWADRRVNARGHRAAVDLTLSEPKQEIEAQYSIPIRNPVTDSRALALHELDEDLGDTHSSKTELIARETRQLGQWQRQLYVRLADEQSDVSDEVIDSTQLVPGTLWTRTHGDDPINPTRGTFVGADLHGSGTALGADTDFVRLRLDGRLLHPLFGRGRLVTRATLGTSYVDDFDLLPTSERFFAGGDQSVRGFDLNSLGPVDENGDVVGGRYLFTASVEYVYPIRGPWAIAIFVDGGNAFDHWGDPLEYGAGVGARYRTPLGMLRVDIAEPLTEGDSGIHLHFAFGPEL
jgi:translocation and assembly module TamA